MKTFEKSLVLFFSVFVLSGALSGCNSDSASNSSPGKNTPAPILTSHPIEKIALKKINPSSLPLIGEDGNLATFKDALRAQIASCKLESTKSTFVFGNETVPRSRWCLATNQKFLALAQAASSFAELMQTAQTEFDWYENENDSGLSKPVLFTGYDAPTLEASLTPTPEMQVPLYRKPSDLVQTQQGDQFVWRLKNADGTYSLFPDRKDIDVDGALKGQELELAYVSDWYSAFILQIQGSGQLNIHRPDGTTFYQFIDYAAGNGRPYVSVGHYLKEHGVPDDELTVPGMREYFEQHPDQLMPDLCQNPSYVFFEFASNGPYGSENLILSPRHSIAVDPTYIPMGSVALFQTQRPEIIGQTVSSWLNFSTLAIAQDVGGAIIGPSHVDIYWGEDNYAELAAGSMHQPGSVFIALLKDAPAPQPSLTPEP